MVLKGVSMVKLGKKNKKTHTDWPWKSDLSCCTTKTKLLHTNKITK